METCKGIDHHNWVKLLRASEYAHQLCEGISMQQLRDVIIYAQEQLEESMQINGLDSQETKTKASILYNVMSVFHEAIQYN